MAARRQARAQALRTPTTMGQVPMGIKEANPEAYWDPRTGSTVIGDPNRVNQHNVGGLTWSGNAMKNGTVMNNTNNASFGMPGPGERRGPMGGRATPPSGTTQSGGQSHMPKPWELPGLANGGLVTGPGMMPGPMPSAG